MKIFSTAQIKRWDEFTILHEPVSSVDLMERAARACYQWLVSHDLTKKQFRVFCGKGNNGGDGLALARMLVQDKCAVEVYVIDLGTAASTEHEINLEKLRAIHPDIHVLSSLNAFPKIEKEDIVIDAILGTGISRPLDYVLGVMINLINAAGARIISIDIPSGMFTDSLAVNQNIIKAHTTLSFQQYKLGFLLPGNEDYCGDIHILDIGLHAAFEEKEPCPFQLTDHDHFKKTYKRRSKFSHKGNYGHAALICGSKGMMGAAILAARGCLRSGVGKLTAFVPNFGNAIMQVSVPEAMTIAAGEDHILYAPGIEQFTTLGIGPGMGMHPFHYKLLGEILQKFNRPVVIDADALNIIAANKDLLRFIPPNSVITPHPKEFDMLFGPSANAFDRLHMALRRSKELQIFIVLKGHYSFTSTPWGMGYFNNTGNAGMATGGSGDVLTGVITGLIAQGQDPLNAALLGVFLHGMAGDIAAGKLSEEAMIASDIVDWLGEAFKTIQ